MARLEKDTLVLNADAQPVSVVPLSTIPWQDAIRIIYLKRAAVMEEYDLWVVRSPSVQMRMPSVIMLNEFQQHNGKIDFNRQNILLRDNYRCQYCGDTFQENDLTYDHVLPRTYGGKTNWENIITSCTVCNQKKGHRTDIKPLKDPIRPTYWELASKSKNLPITIPDERWQDYLNWQGPVRIDPRRVSHFSVDSIDENLPFI